MTALWGGLPRRADQGEPDGRYTALVLPVPGRDEPGRAHRQPRASCGSPSRPPPSPPRSWSGTTAASAHSRPPGSTWSSARSGSRSRSSGIVLLYARQRRRGSTHALLDPAGQRTIPLDPDLTRLAVALAVLGFATKAGLAPMHSWLPDAHSQAPAPVSGLMSGVLLSVALYAILRIQAIGDAALGPDFLRGLLVAAGLLSLAVAAALMLAQRDYKRMLAYSSIEHMGIIALGAAIGGAAGHRRGPAAHARPWAGQGHHVRRRLGASCPPRAAAASPTSTACWPGGPTSPDHLLAGTAALLGFPPFVLFVTEVAIVIAGCQRLGLAMGHRRCCSCSSCSPGSAACRRDDPGHAPPPPHRRCRHGRRAARPARAPRDRRRAVRDRRHRCSWPWLPRLLGFGPGPWPHPRQAPPRSWQVPMSPLHATRG